MGSNALIEEVAGGRLAVQDRAPARGHVLRGIRDVVITPAHIVAFALVAGAGVLAAGSLGDNDLGWHLRAGAYVLDHHRLAGTDPWSAMALGRPWKMHEWLSEVGMAGLYRLGGYQALRVAHLLLVLLLEAVVAVQCFRRATPYRALAVTFAAVFGTLAGIGERPQLVSFILLALIAPYIWSVRQGGRIWPLVPLTWLWANIHGLFFLAPAITLIAALGIVLDDGRSSLQRARQLAVTAVAMVIAAALTPNGPGLVLEPLRVRGYAHFVTEWAPPAISSPYGAGLLALTVVLLAAWARGVRTPSRSDVLLAVFAIIMGFMYIRTVAAGAVILAPLVAEALGRTGGQRVRVDRGFQVFACGVAVMGLVGAGSVLRAEPPISTHLSSIPTSVVAAMPGPQRVIDSYDAGGWLLWSVHTAQPAIDGRTEVYAQDFVQSYLDALALRGDWRSVIRSVHPTVAMLPSDEPLVTGLRDLLGWHTVYSSDHWIVLVPPRGHAP